MSTPDSMGDGGPPTKKARFGDDSGKTKIESYIFVVRALNFVICQLKVKLSLDTRPLSNQKIYIGK